MECAGSVEIRNLVLEKVVRDSALELQASSDWQGSLADAEGLHFQTSSSPRQVVTGFGCGFGTAPKNSYIAPGKSAHPGDCSFRCSGNKGPSTRDRFQDLLEVP